MINSIFLLCNNLKVLLTTFFATSMFLMSFTGFSINGYTQLKTSVVSNRKPIDSHFVMCNIMPGQDVVSKSPFTIPFVGAASWPSKNIKTGCAYKFKSDGDEAAVAIGLTNLTSFKNARNSYNNALNSCRTMWEEEPERIKNLGDSAFFCGKDECGVKVLMGQHILDVNLKGQFPDITAEQKKQSGIAIAQMVIERLQHFSEKK